MTAFFATLLFILSALSAGAAAGCFSSRELDPGARSFGVVTFALLSLGCVYLLVRLA